MLKHLLLVALLGSPHFQTREAASKVLLADPTAGFVVEASSGYFDPEVACRCGRILCEWDKDRTEFMFAAVVEGIVVDDKLPYIDAMCFAWANPWDVVNKHKTLSKDSDFDKWRIEPFGDLRAATASWVMERVKAGDKVQDVRATLTLMKQRSDYYDENKRYPD